MKKRILCFLCMLILCAGMFFPQTASAAFDPDQPCTLTLSYSGADIPFPDLQVDIYRVAKLCDDGSYELLEPFSQYPINIYGISSQQEWKDIAQTVKSYVLANKLPSYQTQTTDAAGRAVFENLETGLYMVKGVRVEHANGDFEFFDFMVYLPTPTDNGYNYDVEAKPKSTEHSMSSTYIVTKLWKNTLNDNDRPDSVSVDILKDGIVQENIVLSEQNDWSYKWEVPDSQGNWSVMEKDVDEDYQVTITNTKTTFYITNRKSPIPEIPEDPEIPQTGDTAPLLLYAAILCVSGLALLILAILWIRNRNDEENS